MARLPRLYAPDIAQLVQAQLSRPLAQPSEATPASSLDLLKDWLDLDARANRVSLHGWLLLNDRITLLATPSESQGLPRLMQSLGRRMATHFRQGSVFAGRYRSALVESGRWVIPTLVWLESLPATLRYVDRPEAWPWSSAALHAGATPDSIAALHDHPDYWACGNTPFDRQARYRQLLSAGLSASRTQHISQALHGQWALGDAPFVEMLASVANRRVAPNQRGRPRKAATVSASPD
jgi:putative transposase